MSAMSLALEILGRDLTGGAFASVLAKLGAIEGAAVGAGNQGSQGLGAMGDTLLGIEGAAIGAGIAFVGFSLAMKAAIDTGAQLEQAGAMASIAISDGAQHVTELENAIVNLANTSQYKIADVDMAFRVLGGLGFDTGQILGGLGQEVIILAQAMGGPGAGVSAADAAQLLGQAIYLFGQHGLTAAHAADVLTGAFYNNMMSVSDLTQFMGMAGGTAASLGVSFDQLMTFGSMLTPMFGSASSAGASLAYMMRNLAHPATSKMADMIKHLGLQIYDANGNFVGLKSIMDQLFTDMQGMTEQQKMDIIGTLFNVRSGRAAMDLMDQTKQHFDDAYNRINGRLQQVGQSQRDSNTINDTGIGTWKRLTSTVNDFFAKIGEGLVKDLKPFLDHLNSLFSMAQKSPTLTTFFQAFLVGGVIISALTLIALGLVAAFTFFAPIAAAVAGVLIGVTAAAAEVAGFWTILHTKTDLFHGALAFLNPVVDFLRMLFGGLGTVWSEQIIPLLHYATPLFQFLGKILLIIAGVIIGVVVVAFLLAVGAITLVILIVAALAAGIQWLVSHSVEWWTNFQATIQQKLTEVRDHLSDFIHSIPGFFANLPGQLRQWGEDMLQAFIDGIASRFGGLRDIVGNVASIIGNVLHHSTPDEGPLKGDDQWGAEMVHNFATSMVSALPHLQSATGQVAQTLAGGFPSPTSSAGYTPVGNFTSYGGGQQVVLPIYIGQDLVAEYGYNTMTQQLTMNGMGRQFR